VRIPRKRSIQLRVRVRTLLGHGVLAGKVIMIFLSILYAQNSLPMHIHEAMFQRVLVDLSWFNIASMRDIGCTRTNDRTNARKIYKKTGSLPRNKINNILTKKLSTSTLPN
jgi:hypothetical protein